jgi:hypothetical protein
MIDKIVYPVEKKYPMKRIATGLALILLAAISGCSTSATKSKGADKAVVSKIPLTAVPNAALAAAEDHVPGIYLHTACLKHEGTGNVYELKGLSHFTDYTIYVTPNGHIQKIDHDSSLSD